MRTGVAAESPVSGTLRFDDHSSGSLQCFSTKISTFRLVEKCFYFSDNRFVVPSESLRQETLRRRGLYFFESSRDRRRRVSRFGDSAV